MNEVLQGTPEIYLDDSTIFMAGIAHHSTQNKKGATVYPKGSQYNTNHSFQTDEKCFTKKTLRTKGELKLIKT